jgi:predicted transglutaminase-like cysteine proteinase
MLNVIKPRALACALAFVVSAGAPQVIKADEAGNLAAVVMPATNRTAVNSAQLEDSSLATALAEIHGASGKLKSSGRSAPPKKDRTSWPTPARFFTINQVLSKRENGARPLELASVRPTGTPADDAAPQIPLIQGEEPFGLFTFKAPDGLVSMKWRKLQSEIEAEAPVIERCRAEAASCTPAAARFVAITKDAAELPLRAKLKLVNERVNATIRYTEDWAQWHQADVWSAPLNASHKGSFDTGMGDCEDYAIAKYAALRQAGVAEKDLRVLLVKDQSVHLDHAVLAARDEDHWVILDNRWSRLTDDNDLRQFVPLFALNHEGTKMFAAPYAERRVRPATEPHRVEPQPYLDAGLSYSARLNFGTSSALPLLM